MVTNLSSGRASLTRISLVANVSRHLQLTYTNYAFSLASVVLLLRAHLPTLAHDATKVRLWMHQPKNDRYLSHGRVRPNARGIYAHTSSPGSATGRLRLAAHVGSAREPRVRINTERIWPRAAVRQISVVFDIFRLVHTKAHHGCVVCEGRQVCSGKQYDTGQ